MELNSGDVICFISPGKSFTDKLFTWALDSDVTHVGMYYGEEDGVRLVYESTQDGVNLNDLDDYDGRDIVVVRVNGVNGRKFKRTMMVIQSDPECQYGWDDIFASLIPYLICKKLGLKPLTRFLRNKLMVCSNAVAEVFWRNGLLVNDIPGYYDDQPPPLPADFVTVGEVIFVGDLEELELV